MRVITSAFVIALGITPLLGACATATASNDVVTESLDPDAPASEMWVSRHAKSGRTPFRSLTFPAAPAGVDAVTYVSGDLQLAAWIVRPTTLPSTSDTPTERLPAVILLHDDALPWAKAFTDAGCIVMLPAFSAVSDAKAAAHFLADDPGVDVDHLYVFGDKEIVPLVALDPDVPFRVLASLGVTSGNDDAFVAHASELAHPLVVYATGADAALAKAQPRAKGKLQAVPVTSTEDALARFLTLVLADSGTTPLAAAPMGPMGPEARVAVALARAPDASRSAP